MKAISIIKPYEISIREISDPEPREGEALLRVLECGICGADVASFTGNQPFTTYPRIPGHEFSAQIISVPKNHRKLKAGSIVTCNPYFNCGSCYACRKGLVNACTDNQTMGVQRDGAFCEYITMPVERIIPGRGLDPKQLALIEPFSISQHALSRCPVRPGDRLLIVGAGPIGLFALLAAKKKGAEVTVCDLLEGRLKMAEQFGADHTVLGGTDEEKEAFSQITNGDGFDVCVEACGQSVTFLTCIEQACQGANLILIGNGKMETTFLHSVLLKKELNVYGSRNAFTRDFQHLIDLVSVDKSIRPERMISTVYDYKDAAEAFDALTHNDGHLEKVLLHFSDPV
ncbi:MAG: zinc-binding alcohol dehydrogenase family protein [Anaerolineaceae bacterium]|nr:zinc-binding alcohol dehydrogenase family protein [Anaerolineaceae bacterium]